MTAVRIQRMPDGTPRLFLGTARLHHYQFGTALMFAGALLWWADRADVLDHAVRAFEFARRRIPWAS